MVNVKRLLAGPKYYIPAVVRVARVDKSFNGSKLSLLFEIFRDSAWDGALH